MLRYVRDELEVINPPYGTGTFRCEVSEVGVYAWRSKKGGRIQYDVIDAERLAVHVREREGVRLTADEAQNVAALLHHFREVLDGSSEKGDRVSRKTKSHGFYSPLTYQPGYISRVHEAWKLLSAGHRVA